MKQDYYKEIVNKTWKRKIPFTVHWELTNRCNLKCVHCYIVPQKSKKELSKNEIKSILDQLADVGALYLIFSGGEIFLRKDFFDISHYARKKGFALRLLTNGTLITSEIADEIKNIQPLSVEISLYGIDKNVHENITKVPGSYEKTIQAIKFLKEKKIKTVIKCPLMKQNITEFEKLKVFAEKLKIGFVYDIVIVPKDNGSFSPLRYRLTKKQLERFLARNFKFSSKRIKKFKKDEPLCSAGINTVCISSYGDVFPCVGLKKICPGNLRKKSFEQLWNSSVFEKFREITSSDLYKCKSCKLFSYCDRCSGLSLLEDGDLLGCSKVARNIAKVVKLINKRRYNGKKRE